MDQEAFWEANRHPSQVITSALSEAMVFKSGGTTGSPKFSYYTRDEWAEFAGGLGRGVLEAGLRSGHRVANLFYVGELYAGFVVVLDMLRYAPVDLVNLPIGGGAPLDSTITTLSEFRVDVVMGAPTTLCRLAEQLLQQDRQLADVELLLFAGEALYDDQRRLLAAAFPNAQARSLGYGSVDAGTDANGTLAGRYAPTVRNPIG
ncbi:phenylacetate--CoA ligase family protein, partial [Streptomyces decoyicus]